MGAHKEVTPWTARIKGLYIIIRRKGVRTSRESKWWETNEKQEEKQVDDKESFDKAVFM